MTTIGEIARDALQTAHGDLAKARRSLLLAAGVLALIHLLTVYPYLEASREIAGVEASMAANAGLLARLEPEIERLRQAGDAAGSRLTGLLNGITEEMVGRFADLRTLVTRALQGPAQDEPVAAVSLPPDPMQQMQLPPEAMQMQQMQLPRETMQMQQMQMPAPNLPPEPMQAPLPGFPPMQQAGPGAPYGDQVYPPSGYDPAGYPGIYVAPELEPILADLAAGEPAWERLIDYARSDIVEEAYARAQREWSQRIRPAYLAALAAAADSARTVAGQAPESAAPTAQALRAAADRMTEQQAALEAIELRHDTVVDEALGTDWWHTVPGKGAYADAVGQSVADQMYAVLQTAQAPSAAIEEALALQEELRGALVRKQEELAEQFAEQRKQLASLSGAAGVVPIDLVSFIGLFPLVLGLVLGFVLWLAGQARRQAAQAAADLAGTVPEDRQTREWLARRVLGAGNGRGPLLATAGLALGALLWITMATWQVAGSPIVPPLSPWTSGALAILLVLAAAGWDGIAIRQLAAQLRQPRG